MKKPDIVDSGLEKQDLTVLAIGRLGFPGVPLIPMPVYRRK